MKQKDIHNYIHDRETYRIYSDSVKVIPREPEYADGDLEQALERIKRGKLLHGERIG